MSTEYKTAVIFARTSTSSTTSTQENRQSIRNTAKITGVSTFTVQKVKREFEL